MVGLLNQVSDRMLSLFVPKRAASACQCSGSYWNCRCVGGTSEKQLCHENCNCVGQCGGWQVAICPNPGFTC
jgi:hypothetical protein